MFSPVMLYCCLFSRFLIKVILMCSLVDDLYILSLVSRRLTIDSCCSELYEAEVAQGTSLVYTVIREGQ